MVHVPRVDTTSLHEIQMELFIFWKGEERFAHGIICAVLLRSYFDVVCSPKRKRDVCNIC